MPGGFDPYHRWLGVPGGKRPDHYRLLGLSPGEADPGVIEAAASRQSAFVAGFRDGPHGEAAAQVLFEIEEARITLLDPEGRRRYEAALRGKQKKAGGGARMPGSGGGRSVGEESGLAAEFGKVVAVIVAGFLVMLAATFYFWDRGGDGAGAARGGVAANAAEAVPVAGADEAAGGAVAENAAPAGAEPAAAEPAWRALFNGRDLSGWAFRVPPSLPAGPVEECWTVEGDRLVARRSGFHWLETEEAFGDYVLSLEWRFPESGGVDNGGGVVVRAGGLDSRQVNPTGVEIDFRPTADQAEQIGTGCLIAYETRVANQAGEADGRDGGAGRRRLGVTATPVVRGPGEWNACVITCRGDRLTVEMNGVVVNEAWGLDRAAGAICLRSQDSPVEYRNVRIRAL